MKTISKKTILAGLLAVAALVPAEVGAFGFNLPSISSLSTCKNFFAMAAKWVGNGCSSTVYEPIIKKNDKEICYVETGWERSIFKPEVKKPVVRNTGWGSFYALGELCTNKNLGADRLSFIKAYVEKNNDVNATEFSWGLQQLNRFSGTLEEVKYLVEKSAGKIAYKKRLLDWAFLDKAAPANIIYLITQFLDDLNTSERYGVLINAILHGNLSAVQLLSGKTDVNGVLNGKKPLDLALNLNAKNNPDKSKIIECLQKHGAFRTSYSPGDKLPNGMIATEYGCKPVAQIKE